MPQPKHAADPPGGPCRCHPDRSSRMWRSDAERVEMLCGDRMETVRGHRAYSLTRPRAAGPAGTARGTSRQG